MKQNFVVNAMVVLMLKISTENFGIATIVIELNFALMIKRKNTENGLFGVRNQLTRNHFNEPYLCNIVGFMLFFLKYSDHLLGNEQ